MVPPIKIKISIFLLIRLYCTFFYEVVLKATDILFKHKF